MNRHGVPYKGLICTAGMMSAVLLLTISPSLEQQFRNIIILAVSASLIPYAFAVISPADRHDRKKCSTGAPLLFTPL